MQDAIWQHPWSTTRSPRYTVCGQCHDGHLAGVALNKPRGNQRAAAIAILQKFSSEEQQQLFPDLVQLARAVHGPAAAVRKIIAA